MSMLLKFVDRIAETPETLFDFKAHFKIESGSKFDPPQARRVVTGSTLADGSFESEPTWDDRKVVLELSAMRGTAEEQAKAIQTLTRLASSPRWLMMQADGMAHPVFFRTRRADTRINDLLMLADPKRKITLTLPAEPFAIGLPESSTVTIRNNPAAAANGMCVVLEPVKGDVPTPLVLTFPTQGRAGGSSANARYRSVVASWSPEAIIPADVAEYAAPTGTGTGPNTTVTTVADAAFVRGAKTRMTNSSFPTNRDLPFTITVPEAGDYRIYVRGAASGDAIDLQLWKGVGGLGGRVNNESVRIRRPTTVRAEWFDLGVVRLPLSNVDSDDPFDLSPATPPAQFALRTTFLEEVDQTFDLDVIMVVPVDRNSTFASQATTSMPPASFGATPVTLTLDGVNDRRYASWLTSAGDQRHQHVGGLTGGLPVASPSSNTRITLLPVVALDPSTWTADEIGDLPIDTDTVVDWLYFPRYLYLRGIE